mmetsp:Transcript_40377/g.74752  ORF Transcript_40377/g.74752 Transcript_40377/m.74752 type:complete len:122 (-) Transcript_40377:269-634(-)
MGCGPFRREEGQSELLLNREQGMDTKVGKREHAKPKKKGCIVKDGTKRRESQGLRGEPAKVSTHEGGKERITSDSVARTPRRSAAPDCRLDDKVPPLVSGQHSFVRPATVLIGPPSTLFPP